MSPAKLDKSQNQFQVPAALGYRMPAEWEPHEATWLAWPHNEETWPGKRLGIVTEVYLSMLEALLPHEKVHVLVNDPNEEEMVFRFLKKRGINSKNLFARRSPTVDAWIRDYGPTFIKGPRGKGWCKWIFNAWGNKYPSLAEDAGVFSESARLIVDPCFSPGIVLEGGSIEVDGAGTCLTTEQCLLNKNRNPQLTQTEIEGYLRDYLGVSNILWLAEGIAGDDTDGHIDDVARFVNPSTIVAAYEENESDENWPILKDNWERLRRAAEEKGRKWNFVKLPMPGVVEDEGIRLPASYANFYIANGVVLLPIYGHPNDERAAKILAEHFPGRQIVSLPCRALVYGLGAIHCVSQQEPA